MEENDKELAYYLLLDNYMKKYNIEDEIFVFPYNTFSGGIDAKIEILVDALNNNMKVSETSKFQDYLEGIVDNKDSNSTNED